MYFLRFRRKKRNKIRKPPIYIHEPPKPLILGATGSGIVRQISGTPNPLLGLTFGDPKVNASGGIRPYVSKSEINKQVKDIGAKHIENVGYWNYSKWPYIRCSVCNCGWNYNIEHFDPMYECNIGPVYKCPECQATLFDDEQAYLWYKKNVSI